MSASQKWDEEYRKLEERAGDATPGPVAEILLALLSTDDGRYVPGDLAAGLESAIYRLAMLPGPTADATAQQQRLMRSIAAYEARKWARLLRDAETRGGH